jgi:hypothetical protein
MNGRNSAIATTQTTTTALASGPSTADDVRRKKSKSKKNVGCMAGCIPYRQSSRRVKSTPLIQSFVTRIGTPFLTASNARTRADFYIAPEVSHRQYAPGDTVKGTLVLALQRPMRVTHIIVRLQGYVQVFKGRSSSKRPAPGRLMKPGSIDRNTGAVLLFEKEVIICGEERLDAGTVELPFELQFPKGPLPTSLGVSRACFRLERCILILSYFSLIAERYVILSKLY